MTFTEAAIEVLRREGKPLHFKKITEIAIRENLLDHVGKIPEEIMAGQLSAHCKLPKLERRVMPVQPAPGTFALVEWGLDEDMSSLDGLVEVPPEDELPYRGRERHPVLRAEGSRGGGREPARESVRARRREEQERHGKRYPPPAEVAYEILAGAGRPLPLAEIAAEGVERLLMPDAFLREATSLGAALAEDNRRREGAGRKPLFQVDGETVTLVAQPEPGEHAPLAGATRAPASASELRKAALAALRRRLRACDAPTVEHLAAELLEKLGFNEVKVAKRGREHVIYTGRRKMGLGDVRHCIRVVRSGADAGRRDVTDVRRDLGHYGAQIGVVLTAGDAGRDARGEAAAAGQLPVLLVCGEALAEAMADAGLGVVPVVVPEVDEAYFGAAAEAAEKEEAARRARREEREQRREGREGRPGREGREVREEREGRDGREKPAPRAEDEGRGRIEVVAMTAAVPAVPAPATPVVEVAGFIEAPEAEREGEDAEAAEADEEVDAEGEAGAEAEEAAGEAEVPGAPGEGKPAGEGRRRRRRRRRRGGRGRREGGAAAASGDASGAPAPAGAGEGSSTSPGPQPAAVPAAAPEPPAAPRPAPEAPAAAAPVPPPLPPPGGRSPGEGGPTA